MASLSLISPVFFLPPPLYLAKALADFPGKLSGVLTFSTSIVYQMSSCIYFSTLVLNLKITLRGRGAGLLNFYFTEEETGFKKSDDLFMFI